MSQSINKKSIPIGAVLLPLCLVLDVVAVLVKFLVMLFWHRIPLRAAINSSLDFGICLSLIIYAAIVVFAFMKKPQFTVFPFVLMAILGMFAVLTNGVQLISGVVDGYLLSFNSISAYFIAIASSLLEIAIYAALAFIAVECFGIFKQPIIARFWAIPGVLAILSALLTPVSSVISLLSTILEFGTVVKPIIGNLIIVIFGALPAVVYGIAIFLIANWLGKSVLALYTNENTDSSAEPEAEESADNGL